METKENCPWCNKKPLVDKDMKNMVYCDTENCPIQGIMMTAKRWDARLVSKLKRKEPLSNTEKIRNLNAW